MRNQESLHLCIESAEAFEQLARGPLPLGLRLSPETREQFRDTYFDTADRMLRARGMVCRLRVQADQAPVLVVTIEDQSRGQGLVSRRSFETLVVTGGVFEALKGPSEPARRMRALIDPDALRPVAAVEVERRIRHARGGWIGRTRFEISCDTLRIEGGGVSRNFYELNIARTRGGPPELSELAAALQQLPGVKLPTSDTLGRVFEILSIGVDDHPREPRPEGKPEIALFVMVRGRAAFLVKHGELRVPHARGFGEESALELLREITPETGRLRLLTTMQSDRQRVRLEVWLAQVELPASSSDVVWASIEDVMQNVGRPGLRHRILISAVAALARSNILREQPAQETAPGPGVFTLLKNADRPEKIEKTDRYLNPQLSFIDFNARVLGLASDPAVPLLERVRYLSIFSSNLDEFFMVHVGALMRMARDQRQDQGDDGFSAEEVLELIAARVRALLVTESKCIQDLTRAGNAAGIHLRSWEELPAREQARLSKYFDAELFPLLTPHALTVSPGHPFPHLPGLGLSVAAVLRDPSGRRMHFSHMRLPDNLPRFLPLSGPTELILLEDVIIANATSLFPGFQVDSAHALRVVRSADTRLDEKSAPSLADAVAQEVRERPFRPVVGIEVSKDMPQIARELLLRELQQEEGAHSTLTELHLYAVDSPLQLRDLSQIADLDLPELRFPRAVARNPLETEPSVFAAMAERDILLHHPYDSFKESVVRLFEEAASDPAVISIKVALYRAARGSRIVDALVRAAAAGKEVAVFVELKARFDEARNLDWLQRLKEAGIPVVSGILGFKVHGKIALFTRREENGRVQRYCHIGTGNYNETTANFYTDLGLLSANPDLTADLADLFNALTGTSRPPRSKPRRLLVAPNEMLPRFIELIEREIEHANNGRPAHIRVKLNSLTEPELMRALYKASSAGVQVDLLVRGLCNLRPGVPGLSENIRVISLLGRFLEHSRIFAFKNGGNDEYYLGSADWRPRNLRRRVEVITPIDAPELRERLDWILNCEFSDQTAWELGPDGAYQRGPGTGVSTAQTRFLEFGSAAVPAH